MDGLNEVFFKVNAVPSSISFTSPQSDSSYYAGTNAPIRLTSTPVEAGEFTVRLTCGSLEIDRTIQANTNNDQNFWIPEDFFGDDCEFSVVYPIPATNKPTIKVTGPDSELEFIIVPSFILNEEGFVVQIDTVDEVVPGYETIDLELICDGIGLAKTWTGIPLNQPSTLSLSESVFTNGPYKCQFRTNPAYAYTQILSSVQVLTQMTNGEIQEFLLAIGVDSGSPWI